MTRLAIFADIHANLLALDAALEDAAQFDIQQIVVAGDIINCGAYSIEVLERLTALNCALMRGNHEFYLLDYRTPRQPEAWHDYQLPPWLDRIIPSKWRNVIAALPDSLTLYYPDAPPVRVVHGMPNNHWKGVFPTTPDAELAAALQTVQETTVIMAHTHLPMERCVEGWHVINPGSVGLPLEGAPSIAQYIILEGNTSGWTAEFRRVPYDISPMFDEFVRLGFLEAAGATARMYIEEFKTARPRIAPFIQWRSQKYPDQPTSVAMSEEFLELGEGMWEYVNPAYWINR